MLRPDRFPEMWVCTLILLECASAVLSVSQIFAAAFCIKFWASLQDLAVLLGLGGWWPPTSFCPTASSLLPKGLDSRILAPL